MYTAVDHRLLGTVVRVSVAGSRLRPPSRIARAVIEEMSRLEAVFTRFDGESDLRRLADGRAGRGEVDPDLDRLIDVADRWAVHSGGRLDPYHDASTPGGVGLDLNAIAKGWIVDRAVERVRGWRTLVIDAGGDVVHRGQGRLRARIENPYQPWDNAAPIATIDVANEAVATSGPSRRGDHLVDPRRGVVPRGIVGATVVAPNAATSDVVATIVAVGEPDEGMAFADSLGLAAMAVGCDRQVHASAGWSERFGDPPKCHLGERRRPSPGDREADEFRTS